MEGLGQVLLALALIELAFRGLRSRATVGLIALASFVGAADFAYFNDVDRYCNALKTVVVLFTTDPTDGDRLRSGRRRQCLHQRDRELGRGDEYLYFQSSA